MEPLFLRIEEERMIRDHPTCSPFHYGEPLTSSPTSWPRGVDTPETLVASTVRRSIASAVGRTSIFTEERLERLTNSLDILNQLSPEEIHKEDDSPKNFSTVYRVVPMISETGLDSKGVIQKNTRFQDNAEMGGLTDESESCTAVHNAHNDAIDKIMGKKQPERLFPEAVLPLLRFHQCERFESSGSFQGSPDDRKLRSDTKEQDLEEPSSSDKEHFYDYSEIRQWAKANNHGSLQIICEYYQLQCPTRGSMLTFQPLEHLHSLEFHRHGETAIHISGSTFDLRSCRTSLEVAEAQNMLLAEEEAAALSVWTVACLCGSLRLEHVLMIFSGALLEKQIVVASSNMGILSASVLSVVPLIRPYQWQSLLMPVLPNDMLDFLDAPVPYIVGIMNMTSEVQSKLMNAILVDADKNQVRSTPIPCLPQHKELFSSLSPYYAKLVGESYLARKRPVYKCTDVQVEAAKSFLAVLRSYLNSLCSNLRSHTITNVQSNDDKVSLLLKESFIASFPSRDRPFMKLFVDTQLFSVHTDLVLSLYQKD